MVKSEWNANDDNAVFACGLFDGCGEDGVRAFLAASDATVFDFAGGEEIPAEVRADCWGIVLGGSVRIFSGGEGGTVLLNVVSRREAFDIAALTGRREAAPPSTVVTAGRCRIAFLRACGVETLMREYPRVAANCFAFFAGRVGFLNRRIHTLSCGSAEGRLADYLLGEYRQEDGCCTVRLKSCVELANRLNVSRATLYRALGALEESGVIARSGKLITILDLNALNNPR